MALVICIVHCTDTQRNSFLLVILGSFTEREREREREREKRKKEKRKKSSSKTFRNIRKQISTMKLFYKAYIKKEYDVQVVPK